jgi:predicted phosphoribosyltransferase
MVRVSAPSDSAVVENEELRNRTGVFKDRVAAARVLAGMLEEYRGSDAQVMAVPAGGVPVGAELATRLGLALDVAVASKVTLPWNTEAGYGAVAFDGTVRINRSLAAAVGLTEAQIRDGIAHTTARVERRVRRLRGDRPWPDFRGRPVIVVDDGLASGLTMIVALEALRGKGADRLVVAVPTAPDDTVARIAERGHAVFCANVREARPFAVADAYEMWTDLREESAATILARFAAAPR